MNERERNETPIKLVLSVREVAEVLGLSERSVWRLSATGELPQPFRIGRSVRWRAATVEQWLAREERRANRQQPIQAD